MVGLKASWREMAAVEVVPAASAFAMRTGGVVKCLIGKAKRCAT